jgi:hypothetical protein
VPNSISAGAQPRTCGCVILLSLALLAVCTTAKAQHQTESPYYARTNAFGFFGAYSNDSSHMLLGIAEQRKLFDFGGVYDRKLVLNHFVNWQYSGEILPIALESDPVIIETDHWTSPNVFTQTVSDVIPGACFPASGTFTTTTPDGTVFSYNYVKTCGRQWTIGEAISPIGMQWNFAPRRKIQPFFVGHGGYMYSTQPIPVPAAGSFNFTFDFGVGIEFYRSQSRSIRAEYRYHHISNHNTANENPGIDNGLFQVTYTFGR